MSEGEETSDTKIAQWVDFIENDEEEPMLNPAEILEEDSTYLDACIELIESRVKVEMETYKKEEVGSIKVKSLRGSNKGKGDTGIRESNGEKTTTTGEKVLEKDTGGITTKKGQKLTENPVSQNGVNGKSQSINGEFEVLSVNSQLKQQDLKYRQMREQYKKKAEEDRICMMSLQQKLDNMEIEENKRQNERKKNDEEENKTPNNEFRMLGETEQSRIKEMRELINLQIEKKHRWIFLEPLTTWRKYLSNGTEWLINNPMNRTKTKQRTMSSEC